MRVHALLVAVALALGWSTPVAAQVFFSATHDPDLRIGPLMVRATVSPEPGPTRVRVQFSVMTTTGARAQSVPDLYLLWPGEVKGDPALGARDAALSKSVEALGFDVVSEGRVLLTARQLHVPPGPAARKPLPGGAPYATFVQTGNTFGLSPPATWIRIPTTPMLSDPDWMMQIEIQSLSMVKPRLGNWVERWLLGERKIFAMSFNEARGRPLMRMYLDHRDRALRMGDAPAEMTASFPSADRLKIDHVFPPSANRGLSETLESTEVVSLFLDPSDSTPQRLSVQFGYFSGTQAWAVVVVPLVVLILGYSVGPLVGRLALHVFQRFAGRVHWARWNGMPRKRETGVVLSRDVLSRIRPGETTYDEVLRLGGPDAEIAERFPSSGRRTLVYRGRIERPQTRRLIGWLSAVHHLEVERHEVTIEFERDLVRDIQADIRRTRIPVGQEVT
jgi:hypothetical protein